MTSPDELYVGASFVLPEQNSAAPHTVRSLVAPGQSLLELAIARGTTPWSYVTTNNLSGTWGAVAGDVLHAAGGEPSNDQADQPAALPEAISDVRLEPTRLVQGKVAVIELSTTEAITLTGIMDGRAMQFFPDENGNFVSLHGIHAMDDPGLYTMEISGTLANAANESSVPFAFSQSVLVSSGDYPFDPVLVVSPETIDPAVTKPEDAQWAALTASATPEKLWQGIFTSPAPPPFSDCWPSRFGNRRSYNGSEYSYFHSGLDFCGGVGTEILAPAAGKVVFAGPLTVRGNATIIDHGWGIYTGYLHQSEILVKVGESVQQGQLIGRVGGTGRVTGPHLHWEVWAGGVQVDPMDWLSQPFPN
jgi:murein DD-endopeptidase MepM/ murein hydrolase activator NlpD